MIGIIIQARMGSTRLPNKVMETVGEFPLLYYTVTRSQQSKYVDNVIVATTMEVADDTIVDWCKNNQVDYYRGSETDVLDRYYQTAKAYRLQTIIRVTSDCPYVDPTVIDLLITKYNNFACDYVSNRWMNRSWPHGLDVEVFSFKALEEAWEKACLDIEREHVTTYIMKHPEKFKIIEEKLDEDLSDYRFTVDYKEDMELTQKIVPELVELYGILFGWRNIVEYLERNKSLYEVNSKWINTEIQK